MQVSVENLEGLERKLTITVEKDTVDQAVKKKLAEISKNVRINGFRPGKVPASVIKARYGDAARQESISQIIEETYPQALKESDITPAGMPVVDFQETEGDTFTYTAVVEVYPEIELGDMSALSIEQESVTISEEDIDKVIKKLQEQKKTWKDVKRKAKKDDQLTIDFVGSIDGEEFEGGKAEGAKIIIGSKTMITGFESGLKGLKTGEEATITAKFPKKYQVESLAGKEAEFKIKVHNVEGPVIPEVDEQFIKDFGVEDGTMESFRAEVKENMERELKEALKNKNKKSVMDALLEQNQVIAPKAMVDEEIKALQENIRQYTQQQSNLDNSLFQDEAERRVKLGLIINKIVEQENITADEDKVREAVEEIAKPYNDPEQVVQYYYSQPNMLKNVEAMVIEEAVVDLVASRANVSVIDKKYDEVVAK